MDCLIEVSAPILIIKVQVIVELDLLIVLKPLNIEIFLLFRNFKSLYLSKLWLCAMEIKILPITEIEEGKRPYKFGLTFSRNFRPYTLCIT
jgi:hypothetical protein